MDINRLVLQIYATCRDTPFEAFQERALSLLKSALPFDSAIWGSGAMTAAGLVYHHVHLHNEPPEIIAEYARVKHEDTVAFALARHSRATLAFHAPTITRGKNKSGLRNYVNRFGHQNYLVSSDVNHESAAVNWIALYRRDAEQMYAKPDRDFASMIYPHLQEALKLSRLLKMERLRGPACEAMAIVDSNGNLYWTDTAFAQLLEEEWPYWAHRRLPDDVWLAVLTDHGQYKGRQIVIERADKTDVVFVRARKRTLVDRLSPREHTVAQHLARGLTHKEIALLLGTSPQTVRNQIQSLYTKLGVHNVAELIAEINHIVPATERGLNHR